MKSHTAINVQMLLLDAAASEIFGMNVLTIMERHCTFEVIMNFESNFNYKTETN